MKEVITEFAYLINFLITYTVIALEINVCVPLITFFKAFSFLPTFIKKLNLEVLKKTLNLFSYAILVAKRLKLPLCRRTKHAESRDAIRLNDSFDKTERSQQPFKTRHSGLFRSAMQALFSWSPLTFSSTIAQFRYIRIQPKTIDLGTRLRGLNFRVCGVYSPEPRSDVYCFRPNFKISKLSYSYHRVSRKEVTLVK